MIKEDMYFIPQRVWVVPIDGGVEVHVRIRGLEHVVISPLRNIHGRFEPVAELHTKNLSTNEVHAWTPIPFPLEK